MHSERERQVVANAKHGIVPLVLLYLEALAYKSQRPRQNSQRVGWWMSATEDRVLTRARSSRSLRSNKYPIRNVVAQIREFLGGAGQGRARQRGTFVHAHNIGLTFGA